MRGFVPRGERPRLRARFLQPEDALFNRDMSVAAVAAAAEFHPDLFPMRCLDAFASSGVLALRWAAECGAPLRIVVNDASDVCANGGRERARVRVGGGGRRRGGPAPRERLPRHPRPEHPRRRGRPPTSPDLPHERPPGHSVHPRGAPPTRRRASCTTPANASISCTSTPSAPSPRISTPPCCARAPRLNPQPHRHGHRRAVRGQTRGVARRRYRAETQPRPPWFRELGARESSSPRSPPPPRGTNEASRESSAPPTTNISCRWWCAWSAAGRRRTRASPRTPSGRSGGATRELDGGGRRGAVRTRCRARTGMDASAGRRRVSENDGKNEPRTRGAPLRRPGRGRGRDEGKMADVKRR